MEKLLKVRCGNPFFRGTLHGVKFEQQAGGAVGMATPEQARQIVKTENFSCKELDATDTDDQAATDTDKQAASKPALKAPVLKAPKTKK